MHWLIMNLVQKSVRWKNIGLWKLHRNLGIWPGICLNILLGAVGWIYENLWCLEILGYSRDLMGCSKGIVFHYLPRFSMHDLQRMVEFRLVYGEALCRLLWWNCDSDFPMGCWLVDWERCGFYQAKKYEKSWHLLWSLWMPIIGDWKVMVFPMVFPTKFCRCWRLWVDTTKARWTTWNEPEKLYGCHWEGGFVQPELCIVLVAQETQWPGETPSFSMVFSGFNGCFMIFLSFQLVLFEWRFNGIYL